MKITTNLFCYLAGFIILCAWTFKQTNEIENAKWLIGTWENRTSKGSVLETWSKKSKYEYSGKSYIVREKDTIVFENIRLVQSKAGLFYIPTVKGQNMGSEVRYNIKIISATHLIFENQLHDFPQIISYKKIGSDSLLAEISGIKNGKQRKQFFPMKRIN